MGEMSSRKFFANVYAIEVLSCITEPIWPVVNSRIPLDLPPPTSFSSSSLSDPSFGSSAQEQPLIKHNSTTKKAWKEPLNTSKFGSLCKLIREWAIVDSLDIKRSATHGCPCKTHHHARHRCLIEPVTCKLGLAHILMQVTFCYYMWLNVYGFCLLGQPFR